MSAYERRIEYGRPGEVLKDLDARPITIDKRDAASLREENSSWFGTKSLDEARRLFLEGWPEGAAEVSGITEQIEHQLLEYIPHPQIQRDVTGSDVDMNAYLSGEPENMLEWNAQPRDLPGIRIVVNISASASVPRHVIMSRGAALVAMIHALQMIDIPAELWIANAVKGDRRGRYEVLIRAHRPGAEIDMERVAFMLGHPSMLRRIIFAIKEREESKKVRQAVGIPRHYGIPTQIEHHEADLYLPSMHGGDRRWETPQAAVTWILKELERFGVELEA